MHTLKAQLPMAKSSLTPTGRLVVYFLVTMLCMGLEPLVCRRPRLLGGLVFSFLSRIFNPVSVFRCRESWGPFDCGSWSTSLCCFGEL